MSFISWGKYPKTNNQVYDFKNIAFAQELLSNYDNIIACGNGRSYGDSALNNTIINVKPHRYFLNFNSKTGVLHCQAGVLLSEILNVFIPKGWFLSVTPGTKLITVGGAIASDVHGKNHHIAGSFCKSVIEFKLLLPDGEVVTCSRKENKHLFRATCGGMGLTGIILESRLKLKPLKSVFINQIVLKTNNLKETFEAFKQYGNFTYSVAWIDCLSERKNLGRSLLMVGEHAKDANLSYETDMSMSIPFDFPSFVLNSYSVKIFNWLYYNKLKGKIKKSKIKIDGFFYPLDSIDQWNRIYGKKGFTQYQFVLPIESSYIGLKKILQKIADNKKGSFLAVLKFLGESNSNWLSFPMKGYTLALDFKIESGLFSLLNELDKIVLENGGRFYLAKDVRVSKETFEAGYEKIKDFRELRESGGFRKKINSLQSKRLGI